MKFYSLDNILSHNSLHNFIISDRSSGKLHFHFKKILKDCLRDIYSESASDDEKGVL